MPLYEFVCPKCDSRFELIRSREKASAIAKCPKDGRRARRVYSAVYVHGEGGGNGDITDLMGGGGGPDQGHDHGLGAGMDDLDF